MTDYDDDLEFEDEGPQRRDGKTDLAKQILMEKYLGKGTGVFYARQLEIWMENEFFHWITGRALNELKAEGVIGGVTEVLGTHTANFYYPVRHRYPRRQIAETIKLIAEFSDPRFTRALGAHGELLVEGGFARSGFRILQQKVRSVDNRNWTETKHDLDFLIEQDGVRYGVEVKNQLGYIGQTEFQIKLKMCEHLGVYPMFIARKIPKNYVYDVYKAGGYSMFTDNQNYPLLADDLAKRVKATLQLPVGVITRLPNTALTRFSNWHKARLLKDDSL